MACTSQVLWRLTCVMFVCGALTGVAAAPNPRKLLDAYGACAATYGQCGGKTCSNQGSQTCSDTQYRCCPANSECQRHSEYFWQCQPVTSVAAPSPSAAVPKSGPSAAPPESAPATPSAGGGSSSSASPAPQETPTPGGGVSTPCGQGPNYFISYLDKTGAAAPDGNYKETCKQIAYDCQADTLTAYCGNDKPDVDEAHAFNYSSLSQASDCDREIMNVWGVLKCQDIPDSDSSDSASGCDSTFSYSSKIDSSGIEAPDGNYKETCRSIAYDCNSDTLYAECGNGKSGDDHAYLVTSIPDAAMCEHNLGNDHGVLVCRL